MHQHPPDLCVPLSTPTTVVNLTSNSEDRGTLRAKWRGMRPELAFRPQGVEAPACLQRAGRCLAIWWQNQGLDLLTQRLIAPASRFMERKNRAPPPELC